MDLMGNAVATWSRTKGMAATENIWAASYNHSLRVWTGALKISGSGSAANSQVAIDPEGNAILIWEEGFPTQIMYRYLSAEGVWTPDLSMPPDTVQESVNPQTFPQIALDTEGNALAIWTEFVGGKNHVHSAKKPVGMSWIYLGEISSGNLNATLIPAKALALNEAGAGIAVWEESNGEISEIHGAQYINGAWTQPIPIAKEEGKIARNPSAGIDGFGNGIVVWIQENKIFSKTLTNGILSESPLIASNPDYAAERPHVRMDAEGNAVVVFERYNAMHKFIAAATLPKNGTDWTTAVDISGPSPSDAAAAGYPVFALNPIGDGVAIWKEWTGSNMVIQGAGFSLNTWSFIKTLSSSSGYSGAPTPAYDIGVTLNHAGNILAIWPEDPSGTGAQQIKATAGVGLANAGPLPPIADPITIISGVVSGKQIIHRFPAHSDIINILSWTCSEDIDYFKVYRGSLSLLIGTTKELRFEDHQRIPKQAETYLITAVDRHGQESGPMTIVVKPL